MKTCIISFSSRKYGNCAQIAGLIRSVSPGSDSFDFAEFEIHPCGNCRYECFSDRNACPYIGDMECAILESVIRSDLTYFIIPNYCDYPCSNYFMFNERSQCFFQNRPDLLDQYENIPKRFIVVSNTDEDNFRKALSYQSFSEPEILFLSAKKYEKNSIKGDLLSEPKVVSDIMDFIRKPF